MRRFFLLLMVVMLSVSAAAVLFRFTQGIIRMLCHLFAPLVGKCRGLFQSFFLLLYFIHIV